ncbi:MAG: HNH endonuclease [Clostridiaceae bacterium]|nr:HNH endonuclease [Clostridiaceae bacterium]
MRGRIWTDEMIEFVKENAKGIGNQEMTDLINAEFGTEFTLSQVKSMKHHRKISSGLTGRFKKGQRAWNKGKSYQPGGRSVETRFKKGRVSLNQRPIGSERICSKDGYIYVKTEDPSTWELKHRVVYEEHFGRIPEGHAVIFADGDIYNLEPDNLVLVKRSELLIMNRDGLIKDDADLTKTGAVVARLKDQVNRCERGAE